MAKTAYRKPKKKVHVFDIVNYIVFILIGLLVLVPIWKVVVDSFNAVGVYQFRLWPEDFTLDGYKTIIPRDCTDLSSTPLSQLCSVLSLVCSCPPWVAMY